MHTTDFHILEHVLKHFPIQGLSGIPEVSSGISPPPRSPPLAANVVRDEYLSNDWNPHSKKRRGGAAYTISEGVRGFLCDRLTAIFLVERKAVEQGSLEIGMHLQRNGLETPKLLEEWVEFWDYAGDMRFRGFVGCNDHTRTMFIFFDRTMVGKDLKPGLMALIECADSPSFQCSQLVILLDRSINAPDMSRLVRDLGWVGFELITLGPWAEGKDEISEDWLLLAMEL